MCMLASVQVHMRFYHLTFTPMSVLPKINIRGCFRASKVITILLTTSKEKCTMFKVYWRDTVYLRVTGKAVLTTA